MNYTITYDYTTKYGMTTGCTHTYTTIEDRDKVKALSERINGHPITKRDIVELRALGLYQNKALVYYFSVIEEK